MTTHPGGGSGSGPGGGGGTGPGRDLTLAVDAILAEADEIIAVEQTLARIGEIVRDAERLAAQLLTVLARAVDPASLPAHEPSMRGVLELREFAAHHVQAALKDLRDIPKFGLPPVGSAVKLPARQDLETTAATVGSLRIATTDGPGPDARVVSGDEPTPGSAATRGGVADEASEGLQTLGAGASSGPSPRHTYTTPDGSGVRRGAGPGYLGPNLPAQS